MRILKGLLLLAAALVAVLLINTFRVGSLNVEDGGTQQAQPNQHIQINTERTNQHLSRAIRFRTVSSQTVADFDPEPFLAFNSWLTKAFPLVQQRAQRQVVNQFSLLYTLPGSDPTLAPVLFTAHSDVVPAFEGPESGWSKPAFSGEISEGYIWGRGAVDDKSSVIGLFEAIEHLLENGFQPKRTLLFAFGHDEEVGGYQGAVKIAAQLEKQGIHAEFMLDEGGVITHNVVAGIKPPVANINPIEKGYATFTISTVDVGGHSSVPPSDTAVARLARAVVRINENRLPADIVSPVDQMLIQLAPAMPFGQRLIVANLWLFKPLLLKAFEAKNVTAALTRTTVAPTVFNAGDKENVLPRTASAKINFRLLPGETLVSLEQHLLAAIDDEQVLLELGGFQSNPSRLSSLDNRAWGLLTQTTAEHFPDTLIAPSLTVGATDARHYAKVSDDQYRFLPVILTPEDITGFHGKNERISLENWHRSIRWYIDFISAAAEQ